MEHLNAERERTEVCIGGTIIQQIYYLLAEKKQHGCQCYLCLKQFEWVPSSTGVSVEYKNSFTLNRLGQNDFTAPDKIINIIALDKAIIIFSYIFH